MTSVLIAAIGLSIGLSSQAKTIPELAGENPGKTITLPPIVRTSPPITFADLLDKSDVIMVGRLSLRRAFLSDNELHIYSEYVVMPRQTLLDKTGFWSRNKGAVLSLYGGEITIGSTTVRLSEHGRQRVQAERDYLLFLSSDQVPGALSSHYGTAAVFEVLENGDLASLARDVHVADVQGVKVDDVVRRISMR
jgi:hypothetical protein